MLINFNNKEIVVKFLIKNKIKYALVERHSSTFNINDKYLVKLLVFLNDNNIYYYFQRGNDPFKILLKNKQYDDFTFLYDAKIILDAKLCYYLNKSCRKFDAETVSFLLGLNENLSIRVALNTACWRDDDNVDIVRILLDYELNRYKNVFNKNNFNKKSSKLKPIPSSLNNYLRLYDDPINNAAEKGNLDIVRLLIDYGANVKANDTAVNIAVNNNHMDIANLLVKNNAEFYFEYDVFMYQMARNESAAEIIEFFHKNDFEKNSEHDDYIIKEIFGPALLAAAKTGHLDTIIALIDTGKNLTKYIHQAIKISRKRHHIYEYLKTLT